MNYLDKLIGQTLAVELLKQVISSNRIAPAYLFTGSAGIGKTMAARGFIQLLLALGVAQEKHFLVDKRVLEGNHPDLLWVQPTYLHQGKTISASEAIASGLKRKAPPQIRIEQVREITHFLNRPPLEATRAVVVIEDAETMAEGAANALLKTLEEPGRATIILIAPSVDSILATLVSRCQRIPFYPLTIEQMKEVLLPHEEILAQPELLALAQGSPGEAIASSKQLQAIPESLQHSLKQIPTNPLQALIIAKEVESTLDTETQLWFLDYLQYWYWQNLQNKTIIEILEKAKKYLLSYVQPRLVWECSLLKMSQVSLKSKMN